MTREIIGFVTDLPKGCVTETDIYTDRGALLCPKMTVIDSKTLAALSSYKGRIHATVSYNPATDNIETLHQPDPDNSLEFEDSFKQYAVERLSSLFKNVDDVDALAAGASEISDKIVAVIDKSKELYINLSKLKVSDEYTYKHSVDVGTMAAVLAKAVGENDDFIHDVTVSGLLHDIGKEKIPQEIINKPAKLTAEEFEIIKTHPVHGYRILVKTDDVSEEMRQGILNHHENVDGTGYPRGLTEEEIGKMGQMLSIVDVYDALVTERSYKEAKSPSQAIEIMFSMGNKFNIEYFKTFLTVVNPYPNGCVVNLSNGEKATVLRQNKAYPLRPIIELASSKEVVNLALDHSYLSTTIVDVA